MAKIPEQLKAAGVSVGRPDAYATDAEHFVLITDPAHVLYDPSVNDPIDEVWLDQIGREGVRVPIFVRRDGLDDRGMPRLLVVAGRKRVKHALEVARRLAEGSAPEGWEARRVPFMPLTGSDDEMLRVLLAENSRAERSTLSTAFVVKRARDRHSSWEEIRTLTNKSIPTLKRLLEYTDLHPEVQAAFDAGAGEHRLPLAAVDDFAKLPRDKQPALLARLWAPRAPKGTKETSPRAVKTHEVRAALRGEQPTGAKMLSRREIEAIARAFDATGELQTGAALLRRVLGDERALDAYGPIRAEVEHALRELRRRPGGVAARAAS